MRDEVEPYSRGRTKQDGRKEKKIRSYIGGQIPKRESESESEKNEGKDIIKWIFRNISPSWRTCAPRLKILNERYEKINGKKIHTNAHQHIQKKDPKSLG